MPEQLQDVLIENAKLRVALMEIEAIVRVEALLLPKNDVHRHAYNDVVSQVCHALR